MTPDQPHLVPSQRAREEAAKLMKMIRMHNAARIIAAGEDDQDGFVQAFARLEATVIEECAKIAERDRRSAGAKSCGYVPKFQELAWEIAKEIRSTIKPTPGEEG